MIGCEHCDLWRGFPWELAEHEYMEHGIGMWGGPDCNDCGGFGVIVRRDGTEDRCNSCRGTGRT